jgi:hypothetical protein
MRPCWYGRSAGGDFRSSDNGPSVERLSAVDKQLLTYLKLTNTPVGLLMNFGAATLREGLHRIVNGLPASASPRLRVNRGTGL